MENIKRLLTKFKKKIRFKNNSLQFMSSVEVYHSCTDELIIHRKIEDPELFACKKGCSYCCNLRVEVLPIEAFIIAKHILALDVAARETSIRKLEEHVNYAKDRRFIDYKKPCPFLNETHECSIYEIRPQRCRACLSTSVKPCEEGKGAKQDEKLFHTANRLVSEMIAAYKSKHLVLHPSELGQSVLKSINDNTLEARWLSGEQVFDLLPEKITL